MKVQRNEVMEKSSRTACCLLAGLLVLMPASVAAQEPTATGIEVFEQMMQDLSNWGRWGEHDQLGTLNFITPATRIAAAVQVTEGVTVSMAEDLRKEVAVDNPHPFEQEVNMQDFIETGIVTDRYDVAYHGTGHTHLDALGHVYHNGKQYNGVDGGAISEHGIARGSIHTMKNGVFTRGVLIDMAGFKGAAQLQGGQNISYNDLVNWEKQQGVKVQSGDAVFIRVGRWAKDGDGLDMEKGIPGLEMDAVKWLHEREVAIIGTDAVADAFPSPLAEEMLPIHKLLLVAMGMPIFDNLQLEALAVTAIQYQRPTFLFTVAPLAVKQGSGSPVNPLAVF